jgi:hypothetical protein
VKVTLKTVTGKSEQSGAPSSVKWTPFASALRPSSFAIDARLASASLIDMAYNPQS